jgi:hypothetical protein
LLQPLKIPEWKWEEIGMDFIVGLPRTHAGYDSIWVIVDRLTRVAHFIPVKTTYSGARLAELYMSRIMCLHGVPKKIVSDRGSQFTSKFWEKLHKPVRPYEVSLKSLGKFKNLIFNSEILFLAFGPADLAAHFILVLVYCG